MWLLEKQPSRRENNTHLKSKVMINTNLETGLNASRGRTEEVQVPSPGQGRCFCNQREAGRGPEHRPCFIAHRPLTHSLVCIKQHKILKGKTKEGKRKGGRERRKRGKKKCQKTTYDHITTANHAEAKVLEAGKVTKPAAVRQETGKS